MSAPSTLVSVREFARLDGCDDKLVRRAIKAGKLSVSDNGKLDPALAGTGWRKRNRSAAQSADIGADIPKVSAPPISRSRASVTVSARTAEGEVEVDAGQVGDEDFVAAVLAGKFVITGSAEMVKENALAAKHLLAARKEAGDVVDLEVADAIFFEAARSIRDAWLNWPARVAPLIAAEIGVPVEPLLEALNKHVQQQLDDLGEPDADFAAAG